MPRRRVRANSALAMIRAGHAAGPPHVNVTPLIDVVMVLIVFYLIVGQLVLDRRGDVELPTAIAGEQDDPREGPIIVTVAGAGDVLVEGEPVEPARAGRVVAGVLAADPDRPVQVRGSRAMPFSAVEPVLDSLRDAGVRRVRFAARDGAP